MSENTSCANKRKIEDCLLKVVSTLVEKNFGFFGNFLTKKLFPKKSHSTEKPKRRPFELAKLFSKPKTFQKVEGYPLTKWFSSKKIAQCRKSLGLIHSYWENSHQSNRTKKGDCQDLRKPKKVVWKKSFKKIFGESHFAFRNVIVCMQKFDNFSKSKRVFNQIIPKSSGHLKANTLLKFLQKYFNFLKMHRKWKKLMKFCQNLQFQVFVIFVAEPPDKHFWKLQKVLTNFHS